MNYKENGEVFKGVVLMEERDESESYFSRFLMYGKNRLFYYNVELYCDDLNTENTQESTQIDIIAHVSIPELDNFLNTKTMEEAINEIEYIQYLCTHKSGWWQKDPLDGISVERKVGHLYHIEKLIFIVQSFSVLVLEEKDMQGYLNWISKDTLRNVLDEAPGFIIEPKDKDVYIKALSFMQQESFRNKIMSKAKQEVSQLNEDELPF